VQSFIGTMLLILAAPSANAAPDALPYHRQENVVFAEADGVGLLMDVFTPTGKKNSRGIIDVVSGAWHSDRGKLKDHEKARVFEILCRRGYTVFAVRPGSISKFTAVEMVDHIERGIGWVRDRAATYGVDPARLGLMGASAGGHLACLTAVGGGRNGQMVAKSIAAVGVFFPPTDFLDYGGMKLDPRRQDQFGLILRRLAFPDGVEKLSDDEVRQKVANISPARRVTEQTPPFLLIHGTLDFMVPTQQSQAMLAALRAKGVSAELILKQGGGHPWPTLDEEVAVMADWFDRKLGVAAPSG
jgi:acetyl esterase/lipase